MDSEKPTKRQWWSFSSLTGMQTLNAFNDNLAKFILIPCGIYLAGEGLVFQHVEYFLSLLLVLPYILFAPTAGWLGDAVEKHRVIRWASWMQIVVLALMIGGLSLGNQGQVSVGFGLAMGAFFLLATQSALLSPAKMGVVKELVGSRKLAFANGIMEGTLILAILSGQIIGGNWFDTWGLKTGKTVWMSAMIPVVVIFFGGFISLMMAHGIQATKKQSQEKYSAQVAFSHLSDLRELFAIRPLKLAAFGVAFFWSFGGFVQVTVIQLVTERTGSGVGFGQHTAGLWAMVVVGIVIGSLLASWICRKQNELGLVVVGGVLLTLGNFALVGGNSHEPTMKWLLILTGLGGALFFVPLNAFLQDEAPNEKRGQVIAASNLLVNAGAVLAIGLQWGMKVAGVPLWGQFLFLGLSCAGATICILQLLPRDFTRLVVLSFFRAVYKIRTRGDENFPREGGVLLLPNHLTYIDPLVIQATCPRPIRFLMIDDCFERKWVGLAARFFQTIPISPIRAKDAIRVTAEALKEGSVVCLFPEGQFSRSGAMCELKRGFEMIARKGQAAVVPVYMDGLWGSIWSFSENNYLKKWPRKLRYGLTVGYGAPIPAPEINVEKLGDAFRKISTKTLADRLAQLEPAGHPQPDLLSDTLPRWSEGVAKAWAKGSAGLRANAMQLAQHNLISRKDRVLVEWDGEREETLILAVILPYLINAKVALVRAGATVSELVGMVSRDRLTRVFLLSGEGRDTLRRELPAGVSVHVFSEEMVADHAMLPCLVRQGRVVAVSIPHPDYPTTTMMFQPGWVEGSPGRLLPGFEVTRGQGALRISGPALEGAIRLVQTKLDGHGFLIKDEADTDGHDEADRI